MIEESAEAPDEDGLIRREWRIALVLLGMLFLAGGILFGLNEMLVLATVYAHWSTPTAEFKAAGDAKMMLALLLVVFGIACLASRRRKHWLVVSVLAFCVVANAAVAAWLDERSERASRGQSGIATIVEPTPPPPTAPIEYRQ